MEHIKMKRTLLSAAIAVATFTSAAANAESMAKGLEGYTVTAPLLTIGETFHYTSGDLNATTAGNYTPPGILDGLGAYELDDHTVRVFANHELTFTDGYPYEASDGMGGTFEMTGTRISYFDIDKFSKDIIDAGIAYDTVYDANGNIASDTSFLPADQEGFGMSRFCSAMLVEPDQFGKKGIVDRIFFTGEETGGRFSGTGGAWVEKPSSPPPPGNPRLNTCTRTAHDRASMRQRNGRECCRCRAA